MSLEKSCVSAFSAFSIEDIVDFKLERVTIKKAFVKAFLTIGTTKCNALGSILYLCFNILI